MDTTNRQIFGYVYNGLPRPETELGQLERHARTLVSILRRDCLYGPKALTWLDYQDTAGRIYAALDLQHIRTIAIEVLLPLGYNLAVVDELHGTTFSNFVEGNQ